MVELRSPDDMHVHLRQGPHLKEFARASAGQFSRVLVMPNLVPPITTPEALTAYRAEIQSAAPELIPLMTFKIVPGLDPGGVSKLREAGAVAGKLYPAGATTNAQDGICDPLTAYPLFEAMQAEGLTLSIHAEDPSVPILDRESAYLPVVRRIAKDFPGLRIVVEHLSTAEAVRTVRELSRKGSVAATITVHHLLFTLDDVIGDSIRPHSYCKPIPKTRADREALVSAATSGEATFFFGSDSAPHPRKMKECAEGASGVFSSPTALPLLAHIFDSAGRIRFLEDFTSRYGAEFYGLPLMEENITLIREPCIAPASVGGAIPLYASRELPWRVDRTRRTGNS